MSCISFVTNNFCIKTFSISLEDIICRIGDISPKYKIYCYFK